MAEFRFQLTENLQKNTIFIVDEASMISNSGLDASFGSGRLLDDLIEYVYSGDGCSLLLPHSFRRWSRHKVRHSKPWR